MASLSRSVKLQKGIVLFLVLSFAIGAYQCSAADFLLEGTYEAAWILPQIYFLMKREPNGAPLEYEGFFEINYGYLDTGASGILLSYETASQMGVMIEVGAEFVDTGVGGNEYFYVAEHLYLGLTSMDVTDPYDTDIYDITGPWRFQITQTTANPLIGPIDLVGMPAMAGKVVVLDSAATNNFDFFYADIYEPNDSNIPDIDFEVPLRFEKYVFTDSPENVPPFPVMAYNPVIDGIVAEHNSVSCEGTWLFDTGGQLSLISVAQAVKFGLTDEIGQAIITPDFSALVGGVGGLIEVPGFIIDKLKIPTLGGFDLVYKDAYVIVHDIGVFDYDLNDTVILDGVFGSNFLSASMRVIDGWPADIAGTVFDNIVIDMRTAMLGFDVNDAYPTPKCDPAISKPLSDITDDYVVDLNDLYLFGQHWLDVNCTPANDYCGRADINKSGKVDFRDYVSISVAWSKMACIPRCGDSNNPRPIGDLDRNCTVDAMDWQIFAEEWLNDCDWLNYNCRGADHNRDGKINFIDFSKIFH